MKDKKINSIELSADIEKKSAKGGLIVFAAQFAKLFLQIISNVALARLLTPDDFGLVAMVMALSTFMVLFKDLGLSQATIQQKEITHEQINTLFWVNTFFSLLLVVSLWFFSPYVSIFYDDVRLTDITMVFSLGILFGGISAQHQALLRRDMKFKVLSAIDIVSMAIGVLSSVALAFIGVGYWALVALNLVPAMVTFIGVWWFSNWRPSKPEFSLDALPMLKFGGYMTCYGFVNYFSRNLDNILIGWKYGADSLGNYSRAYSLLLLPIGQITAPLTGVAVPALSRLREDEVRYCNFYYKIVKIIAYLTMPLIIFMCVLSEELVLLVLGEQWNYAAQLFRYLAFAAFWQPVTNSVGWIYVSLNKPRSMLVWGVISTSIMSLFFVLGLPYGAEGVAIGYSLSMWLLVIPIFMYAFKSTPLSLRRLLFEIKYPLIISFFLALILSFVKLKFQSYNEFLLVTISLISGVCVCVCPYVIFNKFKLEVNEMFSEFKFLLKKDS